MIKSKRTFIFFSFVREIAELKQRYEELSIGVGNGINIIKDFRR